MLQFRSSEFEVPYEGDSAFVKDLASQPAQIRYARGYDYDEFSMEWDQPLSPEHFYTIMETVAPVKDRENAPGDVIDDWSEPDQTTKDATSRVARHERMLGDNWNTFMLSRVAFINIMNNVPELQPMEIKVNRLSSYMERIEFAAAYLTTQHEGGVAYEMLKNASLDDEDRKHLWKTIIEFFMPRKFRSPSDISGTLYLKPGIEPSQIANAIEMELIDMPDDVTDKIIQSTVTPAIVQDMWGPVYSPAAGGGYERRLINPDSFFTNRYCVQAKQQSDGSIEAVPFEKEESFSFMDVNRWLISKDSSFGQTTGANGICEKAVITDHMGQDFFSRGYGPTQSYGYAIDSASLRSHPNAPKFVPAITWRRMDGGKREFVLNDTHTDTDNGLFTKSGLFGIILAAALEPKIIEEWPKEVHGQTMGIAQLPVLAMIKRQDIFHGDVLKSAEISSYQK